MESNIDAEIENCLLEIIESLPLKFNSVPFNEKPKTNFLDCDRKSSLNVMEKELLSDIDNKSVNLINIINTNTSKFNSSTDVQKNATSKQRLQFCKLNVSKPISEIHNLKEVSIKCEKLDQKNKYKCDICNHCLKSAAGLKLHQHKLHNLQYLHEARNVGKCKNLKKFEVKSKSKIYFRGACTNTHSVKISHKIIKQELLPLVVLNRITSLSNNVQHDTKLSGTPIVAVHRMTSCSDFLQGLKYINLQPVVFLRKCRFSTASAVNTQNSTNNKSCKEILNVELSGRTEKSISMKSSCNELPAIKVESLPHDEIKTEDHKNDCSMETFADDNAGLIFQNILTSFESKQQSGASANDHIKHLKCDSQVKECNPEINIEFPTSVSFNSVNTNAHNINESEEIIAAPVISGQLSQKAAEIDINHGEHVEEEKTLNNEDSNIKSHPPTSKSFECIGTKPHKATENTDFKEDSTEDLCLNEKKENDLTTISTAIHKTVEENENVDDVCKGCPENPLNITNLTIDYKPDLVDKVEADIYLEIKEKSQTVLESVSVFQSNCDPLGKEDLQKLETRVFSNKPFKVTHSNKQLPSLHDKCDEINLESLVVNSKDVENQNKIYDIPSENNESMIQETFSKITQSMNCKQDTTSDISRQCHLLSSSHGFSSNEMNGTSATKQKRFPLKFESYESHVEAENTLSSQISNIGNIPATSVLDTTNMDNSEMVVPVTTVLDTTSKDNPEIVVPVTSVSDTTSKDNVEVIVSVTSLLDITGMDNAEIVIPKTPMPLLKNTIRRSSSDINFSDGRHNIRIKHRKKKRFKLKRPRNNECITCGKDLGIVSPKKQSSPNNCATCDRVIRNFQAISLTACVFKENTSVSKRNALVKAEVNIKTLLPPPVIEPIKQPDLSTAECKYYTFHDYVSKITSKPKFSFRNPRNLSFTTENRSVKKSSISTGSGAALGRVTTKSDDCYRSLEVVCVICLKKFNSVIKLTNHQRCHSSLESHRNLVAVEDFMVNDSPIQRVSKNSLKCEGDPDIPKEKNLHDPKHYKDTKNPNLDKPNFLSDLSNHFIHNKSDDKSADWSPQFPRRLKGLNCVSKNYASFNETTRKGVFDLISEKVPGDSIAQKEASHHQCEVCGRRFELFSVLKIHILTYHSRHLNCPSCFSSSCEKQFQQRIITADNKDHHINGRESTNYFCQGIGHNSNTNILQRLDSQQTTNITLNEKGAITSCEFLKGNAEDLNLGSAYKTNLPKSSYDEKPLNSSSSDLQKQTSSASTTDLKGVNSKINREMDKTINESNVKIEKNKKTCSPCGRIFRSFYLLDRHQKSTKCKLNHSSATLQPVENYKLFSCTQNACINKECDNTEMPVIDTTIKYSSKRVGKLSSYQNVSDRKNEISNGHLKVLPTKELKSNTPKHKLGKVKDNQTSASIGRKKEKRTFVSNNKEEDIVKNLRSCKKAFNISSLSTTDSSQATLQAKKNSEIKSAVVGKRNSLRKNLMGPISHQTNFAKKNVLIRKKIETSQSRNLRVKTSVCYTEDLCYAVLDQDFDFDMKQLQNRMPNSYEAARLTVQQTVSKEGGPDCTNLADVRLAVVSKSVPQKRSTRQRRCTNDPQYYLDKKFTLSGFPNRRNYPCPLKNSPLSHATDVRTKSASFNCTKCSRQFSRKYYLQLHMKSHSSVKRVN